MATTDVEILKEKNNFLAAYHALKFSKLEKDCMEAVDIERRCLAVKYFTARQSESEEMAASLLRRSLEDYQSLMEDRNGVNNYWKQIKLQTSKVDNDPQKWVSGLQNIETALDFLNPFSCQSDATLPCCKKLFNDKQIEKIINTWKNKETGIRNRKVSIQSNPSHSLMINKKAGIESNIQNKIDKPTYMAEESYSTNLNYNKPQLTRSLSLNEDYQNPSLSKTSKLIQKPLLPKLAKEEPFRSTRYNYEPPNINRSNSKMKAQTSAQCSDEECDSFKTRMNSFKTARDELNAQQLKANKQVQKKTLGGKQSVNSRFVCPFKRDKEKAMQAQESVYNNESETGELVDERLRNVEPKMIELIKNEIMDSKTTISWNDIAGLEYAKKIIKEVVVYPMLRPDIFTGLRRPPKGILLFGPPGTGKTLIGKCIASQSKSTFFSISASSLTSKWIGEGEKMVRALFAVARVYQPSVIFVDEIDSLLTQRSETEHESSRRLKTEFLVQLDGAATAEDDRILIVGATNRPQELDEAARRRLVKRLYVPLPEFQARKQIICNLLVTVPHNLTEADIESIAEQSKGYSGADMSNLCKEASMGPIRSIPFSQLENIRKEDVRQVTVDDFKEALIHVRPSVSESSLTTYVEWDSIYGTGTAQNYKTQ